MSRKTTAGHGAEKASQRAANLWQRTGSAGHLSLMVVCCGRYTGGAPYKGALAKCEAGCPW